jgi:phage shock protein E
MNGIGRLAALAALLWAATAAGGGDAQPVATVGAEALLARQAAGDPALVVLDVRTAEEFAAGHVPGAINVPHDQLQGRLGELAALRDKDLVVYCKSGRRSGLALEVLGKQGYTRLSHLDGDMQGWEAAGRPVEKAPAPALPAPKP